MSEKPIIVTGGTGFIGSHTAVCLIESGYEVVLVDNLSNSEEKVLQGIEAITGVKPQFFPVDLTDEKALSEVFDAFEEIGAVVHFAALKAVKESVDKPIAYYRNNLFGLINLLNLMQRYQVNNLIFSSSATVYGVPQSLPLVETDPVQKAMSPYGSTKIVGEIIIEDAAKADETLNAISLRYFNPIGAHASGLIGESPNGIPNNLMPFITQTAVGLRDQLMVFGGDYNTHDGTAIRDYIHVEDLAKAHVLAVNRLLENKQGSNYEIFNLGTGIGYSVLDVIKSFEKVSGLKLSYKVVDRRAGDVEQMFASSKRANEELGWKAEKDLDDMTASSWNWEKKNRGINN